MSLVSYVWRRWNRRFVTYCVGQRWAGAHFTNFNDAWRYRECAMRAEILPGL